MGLKFGRIFSLLGGGSETSTEEFFDFLDSDVDEVILYHALAMGVLQLQGLLWGAFRIFVGGGLLSQGTRANILTNRC